MGSTPRAHLAYGYHLGSMEDFKADQRTDYGSPALPWLDEDSGIWGFAGQAESRIREELGLAAAAQLKVSGAEGGEGLVLVAEDTESSVEWDEAMILNPDDMLFRAFSQGWDAALIAALTALGITPTQDGPKWLVFPSYG